MSEQSIWRLHTVIEGKSFQVAVKLLERDSSGGAPPRLDLGITES
jgi:hypothetical protein